MLSELRPSLFVTIGMASDYMQECMAFLRHFEKDIDFATISDTSQDFRIRMTRLFLEARVLEDVDGPDEIQTCALASLIIRLICNRFIKIELKCE